MELNLYAETLEVSGGTQRWSQALTLLVPQIYSEGLSLWGIHSIKAAIKLTKFLFLRAFLKGPFLKE